MLLNNFLHLFLESAPWLLLGLFLAGMLKMFVPMEWMQRQLGGHGFKATVKAALLGAPLPLCSCGVIPAAVGLRRSGASKAATTSFLVSTPETGVDSVTVSYVLLGPFMAIIRPIAAVTSAIVAGLLVGRDEDEPDNGYQSTEASPQKPPEKQSDKSSEKPMAKPAMSFKPVAADSPLMTPTGAKLAGAPAVSFKPVSEKTAAKTGASCCSGKAEAEPKPEPVQGSCCTPKAVATASASCCDAEPSAETASCCDAKPAAEMASCCSPKAVVPEASSCCASSSSSSMAKAADAGCCGSTQPHARPADKPASVIERIWHGLVYASTDLVRDTAIWLLIGLFFAALVQTYVPADFLAQWGNGILAMLVMVLVSIPMYICATASTPIAAGLLLAGVSPGAVLVFMMAGPATNIATLGVVTKELGKRALFGYLGGVLGVALAFGVLVNYLVATFGFEVAPQIGEEHAMLPDWLVASSGLLLAFLMGRVLWQKLPRKQKTGSCCS
ncbi:SO_0444 family Cu/Zn efflux transporter [Shewanella sp. 3B26]|uniref:SO_0444 family Cu/Zn efflux transporter n=1 Tax=Shewanella zhuhaiensis TaxID=2919576 RepID=A0AAJ1BDG9_9GAMM|nr:SO_0444 family Cu/Zn efflux transporter [Shewanella zhuhaiensis]MCH4292718.1 SO_0444 family Cu/Zn efflux transporter [Shewanella zhuhaiensis]